MKRIVLVVTVVTALAVAAPSLAATPVYKATVGPGFTIKMLTQPKTAGLAKLVVQDKSNAHNFHLKGPGGVNVVKGSVPAVGTKTYTVNFKKGVYKFVCDPHPFMKGQFTVK